MARASHEICARCLWLWRDLQHPSGGKRVCYHNESPRFHRVCDKSDLACRAFENAVKTSGTVKGRDQ